MAIALIAIGLLLVVSAAQNTQGTLFSLIKQDLTGQNSFLEWILAIFLVGAIGFIPKLKGLSTALLALVLLAIFLKKGNGFFAQLQAAAGGNATANTAATGVMA